MEKRAAALCCLLIIVLLSGQQQVAAVTRGVFCRCYNDCYNRCRSSGGPKSLCGFDCFTTCPIDAEPSVITPRSAGICRQLSICGMTTTTGAAGTAEEACVDDCTNSLGANHN